MAADKTLKFSFAIDENSFARVRKALQDLTNEAKKFAEAMQGAGSGGGALFGGANVGNPKSAASTVASGGPKVQTQIGKVFLENANVFKNFATSGTQAMRGLTDGLRNSTREQIGEIRKLEARLTSAKNLLESMRKSGNAPAGAMDAAVNTILNTGASAGAARENLKGLLGLRPKGGILPDVPWPGGIQPPGAWGAEPGQQTGRSMWQRMMSPIGPGSATGGPGGLMGMAQGMFGNGAMMVAMRSAGYLASGAVGAMQMSQNYNNAMLDQRAARGAVVNPALSRLKSGDISDILKTQYLAGMSSDEKVEALRRSGSFEAGFFNKLKGATGLAKSIATLGVAGDHGLGLTDVAQDTEKLRLVQETRDRLGETTGYQMTTGRAYAHLNDTRADRVGASRILGLGFNKGKDGAWNTSGYTNYAANLMEQGYSTGEHVAAVQQARTMGGRQFGGQFGGTIMRANAAGFGGYADVLAGAGRGGGIGRAGMLARGALGGGIDTNAGIHLGQTIFGSGFDARGTTSGIGALMAAQGGFGFSGGMADLNTVARIGAGMSAGDRLAGGFDGYQQGRNLVSAIGLNAGGTSYSQDYLGNGMSFKQLLDASKGEMTVTGRSMGLTSGMARSQLGAMGTSVFDRFVDQGGMDPMSMAIREMKQSGMQLPEYLAGLKGQKGGKAKAEAIGAFMGQELGVGEEGGLGLAGMFSGMNLDGKLKQGKDPASSLDDATKAQLKAEADQFRISGNALVTEMDKIAAAFSQAKDWTASLASVGDLAISADAAATQLARLAGITEAIIEQGKGSSTVEALSSAGKFYSSSNTKAGPISTVGNDGPRPMAAKAGQD